VGFYDHLAQSGHSDKVHRIRQQISKGTGGENKKKRQWKSDYLFCAGAAIRVAVSGGKVKHRKNSFQILGIDFDLDEAKRKRNAKKEKKRMIILLFRTEWRIFWRPTSLLRWDFKQVKTVLLFEKILLKKEKQKKEWEFRQKERMLHSIAALLDLKHVKGDKQLKQIERFFQSVFFFSGLEVDATHRSSWKQVHPAK
jgi:hypothetical protein